MTPADAAVRTPSRGSHELRAGEEPHPGARGRGHAGEEDLAGFKSGHFLSTGAPKDDGAVAEAVSLLATYEGEVGEAATRPGTPRRASARLPSKAILANENLVLAPDVRAMAGLLHENARTNELTRLAKNAERARRKLTEFKTRTEGLLRERAEKEAPEQYRRAIADAETVDELFAAHAALERRRRGVPLYDLLNYDPIKDAGGDPDADYLETLRIERMSGLYDPAGPVAPAERPTPARCRGGRGRSRAGRRQDAPHRRARPSPSQAPQATAWN